MESKAHADSSPSLRRDAILEAVAFAAERLLAASDWMQAAPQVLERLGLAAGVSRSYITQNGRDEDGDLTVTWVAEWAEPGLYRVSKDPSYRTAKWEVSGFGRWAKLLAAGEVVQGNAADLPESERLPVQSHGARSLISLPVFVGEDWWGSIGFDDGHRERDWGGSELEALRASAIVLGAAIGRQRTEGQTREAESRYREFVAQIPAVTYTDVPTPSGYVLDFLSPQIEDVVGYPPERFFADQTFWWSIVHEDDRDRITEAAQAEGTFDEEYRMIAADGRIVWVHDSSTRVTRPDGSLAYWQGFLIDVTERHEAEERYRVLVEEMPIVSYIERVKPGTSIADGVAYMSPRVTDVLGYAPERWTESFDFYLQVIHPDDRDQAEAGAARAGEMAEPLSIEYRVKHSDGRWIWIHEEAVLIREDRGKPSYWQGFMQDITARRQALDDLAAAEERYRLVVERMPALTYTEDLPDGDQYDGSVTAAFVSPQVSSILGYTPEEWSVPGSWIGIIHPDDYARVMAESDRVVRERGDSYAQDYRMIAKDGSVVWFRDESVLVKDEEGRPISWQGVMFDITERKESEDRIRAIVEQSPAVIYMQESDPSTGESNTTYVSPTVANQVGYAPEEFTADPGFWKTIIHPDDADRVHAEDLATNRAGEGFVMEYRMIARDGRTVWIRDEAKLISPEGRPPYWLGTMLDITNLKTAEEKLERSLEIEREAAQRLRALDEMKNTFLQAVSHDLRTPLAAILGLAVTLERGDLELEPADTHDMAGRIAENARKLDRLVTNLLDMDRLSRGIITPQLHPTDVGALVRRLLAESDMVRSARIHTDIQPVVIAIDGAKVERIVENLLANTDRHTPQDAQIWVSVHPEGDGVLIGVADDGPGVPEELREAIFEPFLQGPDAPQHSPGVGVGLTLVKRFAELHGGRAWVQQREGGGASFLVFLPDGGVSP